jgi:23S rRNA (adenine2503-C2)-methyltransferase
MAIDLPQHLDVLGLTLAEYAAARGTHPQAARPDYARHLRLGIGVEIPEVSRREDEGDVVKFCLPVPSTTGQDLETESVILPMHSYRGTSWKTLCLSSQVGCRMGCTFCETARMGLVRNLTAAEIVGQRVAARGILLQRRAAASPGGTSSSGDDALPDGGVVATRGRRRPSRGAWSYFADGIQNIVFMGMGEPLDNLAEVTQAIRVLSDPAGLDFPMSQITVSTVGRIDGLRALGELGWPNLRLAISLNAPDDRLRDELMPINKGMPLADLQRALLDYPMSRKGLFLIEYVLLKDVNDSDEHADRVAAWVAPLRCIVNLIPYNPQRDAPFAAPSDEMTLRFLTRLRSHGVFVKRRVTQGRDLMGACGQLGNPALRRTRAVKASPTPSSS